MLHELSASLSFISVSLTARINDGLKKFLTISETSEINKQNNTHAIIVNQLTELVNTATETE